MANIEYAELLQTDSWVTSDRKHPSPGQLSDWFLSNLKLSDTFTSACNLDAEVSDQVQLTSKDSKDKLVTYQKGLVRIISPFAMVKDSTIPETNYTIGIIWSYSGRQPIIKVYRGSNVLACSNMLIMNADDVQTFKLKVPAKTMEGKRAEIQWNRELEDLELALEDTGNRYLKEMNGNTSEIIRFQNTLFNQTLDEQQIKNVVADLIMLNYELDLINSYTFNFGMSAMLNPNESGRIFQLHNLKEEGNNRMWNVYNAFTQHLSMHKTEIDTKPEKVLGVTSLIKLVNGMTTVDEFKKSKKTWKLN